MFENVTIGAVGVISSLPPPHDSHTWLSSTASSLHAHATSCSPNTFDLRAFNYSDCYANHTQAQLSQIGCAFHSSLVLYSGWLTLPLSLLGLAFAIAYIGAVWSAVAASRVSRKCYVLLLNRAFGDVSACAITLAIAVYTLVATRPSRDVLQVMDVFVVGSFWAAMVSYVALGFMRLYAIAQPLHYRRRVTMRRCVYFIALSWFVFLLLTLYALASTALVKVPALSAWSGCKLETCLRPMYRLRNYLTVAIYSVTLACFLTTLVLIRRADALGSECQRKSTYANTESITRPTTTSVLSDQNDTSGIANLPNGTTATTSCAAMQPSQQRRKFRFPLWKLAANVATFALFNLFYVAWSAWALWVTARDRCFFQHHLVEMWSLLGVVRATLMIRIAVDAALAFSTDYQIRHSLRALLRNLLAGVHLPFGARRLIDFSGATPQTHPSVENSSDVLSKGARLMSIISHQDSYAYGKSLPMMNFRAMRATTTSGVAGTEPADDARVGGGKLSTTSMTNLPVSTGMSGRHDASLHPAERRRRAEMQRRRKYH